eukprot:Pgem_evm1s2127
MKAIVKHIRATNIFPSFGYLTSYIIEIFALKHCKDDNLFRNVTELIDKFIELFSSNDPLNDPVNENNNLLNRFDKSHREFMKAFF